MSLNFSSDLLQNFRGNKKEEEEENSYSKVDDHRQCKIKRTHTPESSKKVYVRLIGLADLCAVVVVFSNNLYELIEDRLVLKVFDDSKELQIDR